MTSGRYTFQILYLLSDQMVLVNGLIARPSSIAPSPCLVPVFDHLQYVKWRVKT